MSEVGNKFLELCKTKFQYLLEEDGFSLRSSRKESGNIYKVVYQNKTTSVHINWEFRDNLIYIHIYRLINGNLLRYPTIITKDTKINSFDFENLLSVRRPQAIIDATPKNIEDVDRILATYSRLLRSVGSDVLKGDFSVLPDIEKFIKDKLPNH